MTKKGMIVNVLRPAYDCTNGGVSSKHDRMFLVGEGVAEIFEERPELPTLVLLKRFIGGREYLRAEPIGGEEPRPWYMFGGNFITCSDSRFQDICQYPIPIHDRKE